jgi:hypothetical protein
MGLYGPTKTVGSDWPVDPKMYGSRWYLGRIIDSDSDNKNSDTIWQVRYHDGDQSDYNLAEIAGLLLPPTLIRHLKFPSKLLGTAVRKCYDRTTFHGKITSTFTEKKSQVIHWNVRYSDGGSSDYNIAEIAPLLDTKPPRKKL